MFYYSELILTTVFIEKKVNLSNTKKEQMSHLSEMIFLRMLKH